ncbi:MULTISPECIES: hypothetical protein [Methylosinus]|uniref:hypothetical protein n=1 Tax=Methylosinus TaxID=425 RepID=UPI0012DC86C1|nr:MULTISPECIES: hypothetical protein [Methylosinus]
MTEFPSCFYCLLRHFAASLLGGLLQNTLLDRLIAPQSTRPAMQLASRPSPPALMSLQAPPTPPMPPPTLHSR